MSGTVPVLWTTFHPDAPCRWFWDQGLLENLFDGRLGRTRHEFEHVEVRHPTHWPHMDRGAVVVLPGSYNADRIYEVNAFLDRLPWVLLFVTSDEENLFPVEQVGHPRCVVYVEPDMRRLYDEGVRFLGMQRKADTLDLLARFTEEMDERPTDVFFAGQITHARRERCAAAVEDCRALGLRVDSLYTDHFAAGFDRLDYLAEMAACRVAPCPSGPAIVDSFRLWEALEAGAVPIADARMDGSKEGYWHRLFRDPPFPILDNWADLPKLAEAIANEWQPTAAAVSSWWQRWKLDFVAEVDDFIVRLSCEQPPTALADLITVVVPTSPIESHPSLGVLDATLDSIEARLPGCRVVVVADGVRPEQEKWRQRYDDYKQAMLTSFQFARRDVYPVLLDEWGHQANATRAALGAVRTPLLLFVEHDCPLVGEIPFGQLASLIVSGEANVIRLLHETHILEPHRHLMLDDWPRVVDGVPLVATAQWSQRPHLAATAFYRQMLRHYFGSESRTMIEDVMHGVVQAAWAEGAWGMFRVFIYAPDGDMKRSTTTDGRGEDEPKYDMFVAYDGDAPAWAPRPTVETDEYRPNRQPGT